MFHVTEYFAKSLKAIWNDKACLTPYQYSTVTVALSCIASELFDIE